MTDREKAIVMAHTGICMLEGEKLDVFYQYLNELYGRPVYTHEWVTLDIKEKSKPDFLQLCKEEKQSSGCEYWDDESNFCALYRPSAERHGKWIMHIDDLFPEESTMECDQCHEEQPLTCDDNYCPNCGAKMNKS